MNCVKVRYRDEATAVACARLDSRTALELHGKHQDPLRAYHCTKCHGWHLSSRALNASP